MELTIFPFGTSMTKHTRMKNISPKMNDGHSYICSTTLKQPIKFIPFFVTEGQIEEELDNLKSIKMNKATKIWQAIMSSSHKL